MCSHQLFARQTMSMLDLAGIDTKTFKAHPVRSATASAAASAGITTNQIMIHRVNRFITNVTLICDLSIPKCNYLNGSDHRVAASYSGLHEECEVNISTIHPAFLYSLKCNMFTFQWVGKAQWEVGLYFGIPISYQLVQCSHLRRLIGENIGELYTMDMLIHHWLFLWILENLLIQNKNQNSWQSFCDLSCSGNGYLFIINLLLVD